MPAELPPVLLLLKGHPGSGKSTLAAALAAVLHWPVCDKDDARSPMQALATAHPGIDCNALSYDVLFTVAETQLRCGLSAIIDCPLARRSLFDRAAALAARYGARLALVELQPTDEQLWRRRIEARGAAEAGTAHEHKPGSWAAVEAVRARGGGTEASWSDGVEVPLRCTVDSTASSTREQVQRVLAMLAAAGGRDEAAAAAAASARQ